MNDEIVARFGSNTTGFEQGLQKMRQGTAQAGEAAHASFVHAGNGAREFHKLLHGITEQAPLAGIALKAFISPIGAALTGASIAFGFFNEKIKEMSAHSDEMERGTSTPVFKVRDALEAAKKSLAEFDLEMQKFNKGQEKTGVQKITENLHEQLSLLDKQVGAVEKLSKADKDRLELQKLRVTHGLQGRALHALAGEVGKADTEKTDAERAAQGLLGKTTIASAQGVITAEAQNLEKIEKQLAETKAKRGSFLGELSDYLPRGISGPDIGGFDISLDEKIADLEQQKKTAEENQRKAKAAIDREEVARKAAANRVAEARSKVAAVKGAFDSQSAAIEQTRQAIITSGGFSNTVPITSTDVWLAEKQSQLQAWNKAHSITSDIKSPPSKDKQDRTSNDIAKLNQMFAEVMAGDKLKVEMTILDQ